METVVQLLVNAIRQTLTDKGKATRGKVLRSIRGYYARNGTTLSISVSADRGLFYIISGRAAGRKMPVVPNTWELVPDLAEWKEAVKFEGSDYLLARAIARDGIAPVPILDEAYKSVRSDLLKLIAVQLAFEFKDQIANGIKQTHGAVK